MNDTGSWKLHRQRAHETLWGSLKFSGAQWSSLGLSAALGLAGCRDTFRQAAPTGDMGTRKLPKALDNIRKISKAERWAGKGHWQRAQKAILESR